MSYQRVGLIGGTGLEQLLQDSSQVEEIDMATPFGDPSAKPIVGHWNGVDVVFIARHGKGHRFNPSNVPYRANIWAMKKLGVEAIIASGATGSLRENIKPGHLVICDNAIDRTFRRAGTFFDRDLAVHVEFADPFCPHLRQLLAKAGEQLDAPVHNAGTYVCMEGPQFSTRAESNMHRQWGGDLVGMTVLPEAKLAREAEICYALVAMATDYDCWRPVEAGVLRETLLQEIMGNLRRATQSAIGLIGSALPLISGCDRESAPCQCRSALQLAIWSDLNRLDDGIHDGLEPLLRRYLADK
jgi:5'-methylthioadenosine phosphorylase